VLAVAHDEHSLEAVNAAAKKKFIDAILVGNADEIKKIAEEYDTEKGHR
jgi:phosphate butyryltransferase